jgi:hypothetical protein
MSHLGSQFPLFVALFCVKAHRLDSRQHTYSPSQQFPFLSGSRVLFFSFSRALSVLSQARVTASAPTHALQQYDPAPASLAAPALQQEYLYFSGE